MKTLPLVASLFFSALPAQNPSTIESVTFREDGLEVAFVRYIAAKDVPSFILEARTVSDQKPRAEVAIEKQRFTRMRDYRAKEDPVTDQNKDMPIVPADGRDVEYKGVSLLVAAWPAEQEFRVTTSPPNPQWTSEWFTPKPPPDGGKGVVLSLPASTSLRLDVRNTDQGLSDLGIDYELRLFQVDAYRSEDGQQGGGLAASSKGYLKNTSSTTLSPSLDSITNELSAYVDRIFPASSRLYTFTSLQVHAKNEATQDYDTSTYTAGAGLSFDLGFLIPLNSETAPSWLQRVNFFDQGKTKRPIDAPRFYVGYDLVAQADKTNRPARTGDPSDEYNRLQFGAAWSLPVFRDSHLTISWDGFHDLDADRDAFKSLVEVTLNYPLVVSDVGSKGTSIILKYVDGGLPPNYTTESAIVAGFSVLF